MAKFEDLTKEVKKGWSAEAHAVHERASQVFADAAKDQVTANKNEEKE